MATHAPAGIGLSRPAAIGESFERLSEAGLIEAALSARLRRAIGFRNLAVHACSRIDWAVVHVLAAYRRAALLNFSRQRPARSQRLSPAALPKRVRK